MHINQPLLDVLCGSDVLCGNAVLQRRGLNGHHEVYHLFRKPGKRPKKSFKAAYRARGNEMLLPASGGCDVTSFQTLCTPLRAILYYLAHNFVLSCAQLCTLLRATLYSLARNFVLSCAQFCTLLRATLYSLAHFPAGLTINGTMLRWVRVPVLIAFKVQKWSLKITEGGKQVIGALNSQGGSS